MEMRKCPNGHYYDTSVHQSCPYCESAGNNVGATVPMQAPGQDSKTMPLGYQASTPVNTEASKPIDDDEDGRTVAIIRSELGIDPVVGWLVCEDGKEKGRDYRIHTDNNFIGRGEKMDICIRGDETISRENHAIVSYDSQEKIFYFSPGDGRSIVRLNDKAIFQTMELKAYDRVTIGKTKLLFVPLCGPDFEWG